MNKLAIVLTIAVVSLIYLTAVQPRWDCGVLALQSACDYIDAGYARGTPWGGKGLTPSE